ncbi:MAG: ATP-binding cassette domain-containing protein [Rubrivivax sp.]|nr:ATP-binding cassette domain-containing protein [Rubrivivax sp.]
MSADIVVDVQGVVTRFGAQTVHDGLNLQIRRGELVALIGGSGSGKSVLLREILGLQRPTAGTVHLLGTDMWHASEAQLAATRRRFGMMFQEGALFSSLDVAGNVATPLREHADTPPWLLPRLVNLRLTLAGLGAEVGAKMPSQLSGGMKKRAALARALALDPRILFFDEPSAGLDPITSVELDELIVQVNKSLGTTIVVVSHELPSIFTIADRCIMLDPSTKSIIAEGPPKELRDRSTDPRVHAFFNRQPGEDHQRRAPRGHRGA